MDATNTQLQEVALEAALCFETAERPDGSSFIRIKDDSPEWVKDLVYKAHGGMEGMLPDDWRYDKIQDALSYIGEVDDPEDSAEFADEAVDIYTSDRVAWLASNISRAAYCDDAAANFGGEDTCSDIIGMIGWGQYEEAGEIYSLVLSALRDHVSAEVES